MYNNHCLFSKTKNAMKILLGATNVSTQKKSKILITKVTTVQYLDKY